jgi:transketolase N-terminal domain/subunit
MPVAKYTGPELEINTIRAVSANQPESANSGHPGALMGCAPMAYLLWTELMKYSGKSPKWMNRDRFVLSNGQAGALQYTMLHLAGYGAENSVAVVREEQEKHEGALMAKAKLAKSLQEKLEKAVVDAKKRDQEIGRLSSLHVDWWLSPLPR